MGVRIWIGPWVIQTSVSPLDFPGLCTHHTAWVRACGLRGRDGCRSRGPGGRGARGREQVAWAQSETRGRGWSSRGSWGGREWGKTHGKGGSRGSVGGKPRHRAQQHLKDEQGARRCSWKGGLLEEVALSMGWVCGVGTGWTLRMKPCLSQGTGVRKHGSSGVCCSWTDVGGQGEASAFTRQAVTVGGGTT